MQYDFIRSDSIYKLKDRVNIHLNEGWKCQGGIHYDNDRYIQAMIKQDSFKGWLSKIVKKLREE